MSSSLLTPMLGRMLDNLSVCQSPGQLMGKHFTAVSPTILFESGESAHKKSDYGLDFKGVLFVVLSILLFFALIHNAKGLSASLVWSDMIFNA